MIIRGIVQHGRGLGHQIGAPTANVDIESGLDIKLGVYSSRVTLRGADYRAVTHIGTNPTVGGNPLRSESHIFDFEGDIYGEPISVELLDFIRGEMKFSSLEALIEQIHQDIEAVKDKDLQHSNAE